MHVGHGVGVGIWVLDRLGITHSLILLKLGLLAWLLCIQLLCILLISNLLHLHTLIPRHISRPHNLLNG